VNGMTIYFGCIPQQLLNMGEDDMSHLHLASIIPLVSLLLTCHHLNIWKKEINDIPPRTATNPIPMSTTLTRQFSRPCSLDCMKWLAWLSHCSANRWNTVHQMILSRSMGDSHMLRPAKAFFHPSDPPKMTSLSYIL
jgi:hypothetical protein